MKSITRITRLAALLVALLTSYTHAAAQTTLPLNTGYNHQTHTAYTAGQQDNYWINIASYPAGSSAVGPARVIPPLPGGPGGPWAPPSPGAAWVSGWNTYNSPAGTNVNNPAYTIFRKCFCLLPGFKNASLTLNAVRADDNVQGWLNSVTNQLLAPSQGHFNGPALGPVKTEKGFRAGKNCLYALVEDQFGFAMGFYLEGSITAHGLLPSAAAGAGQSFAPCACQRGGPAVGVETGGPRDVQDRRAAQAEEEEERQTVRAIVELAERRRRERQKGRQ